MRIGIDLDGVCYDFAESVRRFIGNPDLPDTTCWNFYEEWGYSLDYFLDICRRGVNAGVIFGSGDPRPGTREALCKLKDAGHSLHIITDRRQGDPGRAAELTYRWLARNDLPFDSVTFSADKTIVPTDYMIEDKLENYDALGRTNCRPYLVTRPWNDEPDERRRVGSILEFANLITSTRIIGLAGYARTGKDTAAKILVEHGFRQAAFARRLKQSLEILNPILHPETGERICDIRADDGTVDWERIKESEEGRRLPQAMGTDVGRVMFGDSIWVDQAMRSVPAGADVVFSDCRFPNEADAIKATGGEIWRLVRPGYTPTNGHVSETALDRYPVDHILYNVGTVDDLRWRIDSLLQHRSPAVHDTEQVIVGA